MASRKVMDAKAKAKRQKMIAIGGGVVFLLLLVIQVPRTMKMLNAKPAAEAVQPAPETPAPAAPAAPAPGGPAPPATPAEGQGSGESGGTAIADSDPIVLPSDGQLVSFELFAGKDPFEQQVTDKSPSGGSAGGGEPAKPADGEDGAEDGGAEGEPAAGGGDTGGGTATPAPGAPGTPSVPTDGGFSAPGSPGETAQPAEKTVIAVNGVEGEAEVGKDFPADDPLFTLVALGPGAVEIAVAGGTYASGDETVTLELGTPLTLMNTADGSRYELELIAVSGQ